MYFRHKLDTEKLTKIAEIKLPSIEFDLADMDTLAGFEVIIRRVVRDTAFKSCLFCSNEKEQRHRVCMSFFEKLGLALKGLPSGRRIQS
jgi:hypothetical protein